MTTRISPRTAGVCLAAIAAATMLADASLAAAQPAQGYDNSGQYDNSNPPPPPPNQYGDQGGQYGAQSSQYGGQYDGDANAPAPPRGQYAEPPPGEGNNGAAYDDRSQQADRGYADRYDRWAAQNCVDRRNNNTAAGAIIGGVLGAVIGAGVAGRGDQGAGALIGGALGAGTGAAIGSSSSAGAGCPPGYVVRAGAPAFYYGGYGAGVAYAPVWYRPWVWSGGRWNYYPYRYWYWNHRAYWRPGWRPGPWRYRYNRW